MQSQTSTIDIDDLIQENTVLPFDSLEEMCAAKWADGEGPRLNGLFWTNRRIAEAYNAAQEAACNPTRATLY